ncbi:MAG: NAD-dependent deacylase [Gammaproteobacteria bacterium]|nr:NAD-dependent deacylase [Gammaproteobacteria bacterium]
MTNTDNLIRAKGLIASAERVAVLTGAGISAESGVPTFRGKDGLWKNYRAEDLASPEAFRKDPGLVWEWYDWRRSLIAARQPNPGHYALVKLEEQVPAFTLITQNVDGLHDLAGSSHPLKLHGDIWTVRCTRCTYTDINRQTPLPEIPPRCDCGSLLRPDIIWFGEALPEATFREAWQAAESAEVFIVAGTSALVQPAASLPLLAAKKGAKVVEVNLEETPLSPHSDIVLPGPAGDVLPQLLA